MRIAVALVVVAACSSKHQLVPQGAGSGEGEAAPFVKTAFDALVGHRAPAVALEMLDGTRIDLAKDLGHRPIYLKFWATWCVPCREQMPHLDATYRAHGSELAMYAIDVGVADPIENVKKFVTQKQLAVPIAYDRDGSIAEQFHLNVTPQHILIDRTGVVRYVGHAVTPELERAIVAVIDPATTTTAAATLPEQAQVAPLTLDDGTKLDLASHGPIAITFATLFCDSYIAESRPEIGATCAAHARQVQALHAAHPTLRWVTVAYPVWTSADDIGEYRKRLGATVPIGIDRGNAWFHKFGVGGSVTTVLLDGAGAELGRADGDGAALPALIAKLN